MENIQELAALAEKLYEQYDKAPPAPAHDALAAALGVAAECTGNSDTAILSRVHTPKSGLVVSFYAVSPAHRTERYLTRAYYQAEWKGAKYRGDIIVSTTNYHADNDRGFSCFDLSHYAEHLPEGCRKLVAGIVADTLADLPAGTLDALAVEFATAGKHWEISSYLHKVNMAADDALRAYNKVGE